MASKLLYENTNSWVNPSRVFGIVRVLIAIALRVDLVSAGPEFSIANSFFSNKLTDSLAAELDALSSFILKPHSGQMITNEGITAPQLGHFVTLFFVVLPSFSGIESRIISTSSISASEVVLAFFNISSFCLWVILPDSLAILISFSISAFIITCLF